MFEDNDRRYNLLDSGLPDKIKDCKNYFINDTFHYMECLTAELVYFRNKKKNLNPELVKEITDFVNETGTGENIYFQVRLTEFMLNLIDSNDKGLLKLEQDSLDKTLKITSVIIDNLLSLDRQDKLWEPFSLENNGEGYLFFTYHVLKLLNKLLKLESEYFKKYENRINTLFQELKISFQQNPLCSTSQYELIEPYQERKFAYITSIYHTLILVELGIQADRDRIKKGYETIVSHIENDKLFKNEFYVKSIGKGSGKKVLKSGLSSVSFDKYDIFELILLGFKLFENFVSGDKTAGAGELPENIVSSGILHNMLSPEFFNENEISYKNKNLFPAADYIDILMNIRVLETKCPEKTKKSKSAAGPVYWTLSVFGDFNSEIRLNLFNKDDSRHYSEKIILTDNESKINNFRIVEQNYYKFLDGIKTSSMENSIYDLGLEIITSSRNELEDFFKKYIFDNSEISRLLIKTNIPQIPWHWSCLTDKLLCDKISYSKIYMKDDIDIENINHAAADENDLILIIKGLNDDNDIDMEIEFVRNVFETIGYDEIKKNEINKGELSEVKQKLDNGKYYLILESNNKNEEQLMLPKVRRLINYLKPKLIHFTGHIVSNEDETGLDIYGRVLPAGSIFFKDKVVTRPRLVFLNGCKSNLENIEKFNRNLPLNFYNYMHSTNVIFTNMEIGDRSSRNFIEIFYRRFSDDNAKPFSELLKETRIEFEPGDKNDLTKYAFDIMGLPVVSFE